MGLVWELLIQLGPILACNAYNLLSINWLFTAIHLYQSTWSGPCRRHCVSNCEMWSEYVILHIWNWIYFDHAFRYIKYPLPVKWKKFIEYIKEGWNLFFEYIGTATLDILFRQITIFIKVCVVFVFGLLTVVPFWFSNRSIVSKSFSLFAVTKIHNHDSKIGLKLLIILKNQPERIKNELISIGKKAK